MNYLQYKCVCDPKYATSDNGAKKDATLCKIISLSYIYKIRFKYMSPKIG